VTFAMPLLPDPTLATFKAYRVHDDFEDTALHGTFLIDREGRVRFARIGPEPFLDVEFLKREAARLDRLVPARADGPAAAGGG
jgi:peroxiredoxin